MKRTKIKKKWPELANFFQKNCLSGILLRDVSIWANSDDETPMFDLSLKEGSEVILCFTSLLLLRADQTICVNTITDLRDMFLQDASLLQLQLFSGQSYKRLTLIDYNSKVVIISKLLMFMTLES